MKKLIASLLIISFNAYSYPVGVQSQNGTAQYPALVKTPYSQVSKLPDGNSIIDTGNENMLVDAGMESVGVSVWTCTTGTCTKSGTNGDYSSGKQALKVALSTQALNVSQSVATSTGIQTQGIVGVLYKVPSAITDFQVCSLIAGAEQTCVPTNNLIKDNLYHSIEIPIIMTAGSTVGIKFKTTATYTQNVFLDAAYVKQGLGTQNLMLDNVYSAIVTTTSGSITNSNKSFIASCTAANPTVCTFVTGIFTVAPNCSASYGNSADGNATVIGPTTSTGFSIATFQTSTGGGIASKPSIIICQKSGNDYLAASSSVYSQASADVGWTAYTPSFTGFGSVTVAESFYKRTGDSIYIKGRFNSGISTSVTAFIGLPSGLTVDSTKETSASLYGGQFTNQSSSTVFTVLASGSASGINIGNAASSGMSALVATSIATNGQLMGYIAGPIPISDWSNSNVIVGSFAGVPAVPGYQGNVDTFSVSFGTTNATTVCSASPCSYLDQIGNAVTSITRSGVGTYTLNFSKTYSKIKCVADIGGTVGYPNGIGQASKIQCSSCNSANITTFRISTNAADDSSGVINCMGSF